MNLLLAAFFSVMSAYCCYGAGGSYCGRTASGVPVHAGSVAADWRVLPPGTRLSIPGYPVIGVVEDTGSAITGTRLDVFFWSCADARAWGVRRLLVTVLPPEPPAPITVEIDPAGVQVGPSDLPATDREETPTEDDQAATPTT